MKRHGILRAVNEVNKFSEFFEGSPPRDPKSPVVAQSQSEPGMFPF